MIAGSLRVYVPETAAIMDSRASPLRGGRHISSAPHPDSAHTRPGSAARPGCPAARRPSSLAPATQPRPIQPTAYQLSAR